MRLIDADDFFERLCDRDCDIVPQYSEDGYSIERIEETLDETPTVDAVQVVRCKDCEFWDDNRGILTYHACRLWSAVNSTRYTADMDFCSKGERADA